jgi:hypothetical protein
MGASETSLERESQRKFDYIVIGRMPEIAAYPDAMANR